MRQTSGNKGYTLVEVLASLAIIMIVLLPVMGYFTDGYRNISREGTKTQVVVEAERAMESLYAWMQQQQTAGTLAHPAQFTPLEPDIIQFQAKTGFSTMITYKYDIDLNGWHTQVTTRWNPQQSQSEQTFTLTSFFGDYRHVAQ